MAKKITNEDRVLAVFQAVGETEARQLLFMANFIVKARFPGPASAKPVVKRGRPVSKSKATGATDTSPVDAGSGTGYLTA